MRYRTIAGEMTDLLIRYNAIESLIEQALAAIAAGDRERAILLSHAVVQQTSALDRRLAVIEALRERSNGHPH